MNNFFTILCVLWMVVTHEMQNSWGGGGKWQADCLQMDGCTSVCRWMGVRRYADGQMFVCKPGHVKDK